ncbi:MAG TPA: DUF2127 domain-containing protein [Acidimicrobiales bacterium]|nr:DUF2127 domain-containing protein [Acidimicrobiales bacterium]
MARRETSTNRYELLTCAWKGHVLVGRDAATVTVADALVVREADGLRWYRCLRCDAWVPKELPIHPAEASVPSRDEITLPERGPLLRDRYVLRLIAIERGVHVVLYGALAILFFIFSRHHTAFQQDYNQLMNDLSGGDPASIQLRGVLGHLKNLFKYTPTHLYELGIVLAVYAALEATEMVGLWLAKRWAEYLTLVSTTLFIPFEVYEISEGVSAFKVIILVINVAIVVYLLVAKRLFGIRGGHRVEHERRHQLSGWGALERATPGFESSHDQPDAAADWPLVDRPVDQARSTTA